MLLACGHTPAQLVEEVEQDRHVNRAFLLTGCVRSGRHRKALAIRRESQVPFVTAYAFADLRVGPDARFVRGGTKR